MNPTFDPEPNRTYRFELLKAPTQKTSNRTGKPFWFVEVADDIQTFTWFLNTESLVGDFQQRQLKKGDVFLVILKFRKIGSKSEPYLEFPLLDRGTGEIAPPIAKENPAVAIQKRNHIMENFQFALEEGLGRINAVVHNHPPFKEFLTPDSVQKYLTTVFIEINKQT
jgi:hypothetical protein